MELGVCILTLQITDHTNSKLSSSNIVMIATQQNIFHTFIWSIVIFESFSTVFFESTMMTNTKQKYKMGPIIK